MLYTSHLLRNCNQLLCLTIKQFRLKLSHLKTRNFLYVQIFKTEVCDGIIAPGFEPEALEILKNKKKVMGNSDINTVTLSCFVVDDLDNEFI
jgi:hypothetical protein